MEIHYQIILVDAIVDADEDKKWIKWYFIKYHFCILQDKNSNITIVLQVY